MMICVSLIRFHWRNSRVSLCCQAPNPTASEFIPKGAPRMAAMASAPAFPSPLFPHPGLGGSTAAALAPGEAPVHKS